MYQPISNNIWFMWIWIKWRFSGCTIYLWVLRGVLRATKLWHTLWDKGMKLKSLPIKPRLENAGDNYWEEFIEQFCQGNTVRYRTNVHHGKMVILLVCFVLLYEYWFPKEGCSGVRKLHLPQVESGLWIAPWVILNERELNTEFVRYHNSTVTT